MQKAAWVTVQFLGTQEQDREPFENRSGSLADEGLLWLSHHNLHCQQTLTLRIC